MVPNELQELKQKTRQTNTDMEEVRSSKSSYSHGTDSTFRFRGKENEFLAGLKGPRPSRRNGDFKIKYCGHN